MVVHVVGLVAVDPAVLVVGPVAVVVVVSGGARQAANAVVMLVVG